MRPELDSLSFKLFLNFPVNGKNVYLEIDQYE